MPKVRVVVELRAETEVELEVDIEDGVEPTNLSQADQRRALDLARLMPVEWEMGDVRVERAPSGCAELCWNEECRRAGRCEG